ncbi:hypothetical protein GRF29_28g1645771, partial [Pseudopithomyces chartarum]
DITAATLEAFSYFVSENSLCALPISLVNTSLEPLPPVAFPQDPNHTFQQTLNQVESILDTKTALYLIIRQEKSMVAITYVPYRADAEIKRILLENRDVLSEKLGTNHFTSSIICKEIGEITDARSWDERSATQLPGNATDHTHDESCKHCKTDPANEPTVQDLGHQRTKCRLCDRRMKNKITPDALHALKNLTNPGDCVQLVIPQHHNRHPNPNPPPPLSRPLPPPLPPFPHHPNLHLLPPPLHQPRVLHLLLARQRERDAAHEVHDGDTGAGERDCEG